MAGHTGFSLKNIKQEDILRAVTDRIRLQAQRPAQRLAQTIRTTGGGLRTSGVSLLPQIEQVRARTAGEAGAVTQLGTQELGQRFQASESALNRALRLQLFREEIKEKRAAAARATRGGLQQSLLSGGVGLITDVALRRIPKAGAPAGGG